MGRAASLVQVESRWKRELSDKGGLEESGTQQERFVAEVDWSVARLAEMKRVGMRARRDFIDGID